MTGPGLSVGDSLGYGWREVTGRLGFWVGVMLTVAAVAIGPDLLASRMGEGTGLLRLTISLFGTLLHALVQIGLIDLALRAVDGRELRVGLLFGRTDILLRYFVASILFGLAVVLGLLFLIVPGMIAFVLFFFYGHEMASEDAGIGAAFEGSMDLTKGRRLEFFLLLALLWIVNVVGALALVVGLLVTIPISAVALAHWYRGLQAFHRPRVDQGLSQ